MNQKHLDHKRRALIAAYRHRLVDGPVLLIPLTNARFGFNPSNLVPMEGIGTVYPTMTATGSWGKLEVENGALMTSDYSKVYIAAPSEPNGSILHGDGWTLSLNPGWRLAPGERKGDFTVVSSQ